MYHFILKSLSRCLKAIHNNSKSEYLIGANTTTSAYLISATYEDLTKKLDSKELVDFSAINREKIINEVIDIYPYNEELIYIQVLNQTDDLYQLKAFKRTENVVENIAESVMDITTFDSKSAFDIKIANDKYFKISKEKFEIFENENFISVSSLDLTQIDRSAPVKICSDVSPIDHNTMSIGLYSDISLIDIKNNKIESTIKDAHYNGIVSCEFDPMRSFILCTSGMDYSVKFWDIRKTSSPIAGIYDNSHWVWSSKFNKSYSRLMITCSSSSSVRAIVFEKEEETTEDNSAMFASNFRNYTVVDYIEFEDSVYALDWSLNDPWTFAAVSYNANLHINTLPENLKYKIILDN